MGSFRSDAEPLHDGFPLGAMGLNLCTVPLIDDQMGVLVEYGLSNALLGREKRGAEADARFLWICPAGSHWVSFPFEGWWSAQCLDRHSISEHPLRSICLKSGRPYKVTPRPGPHGGDYGSPGEASEYV